MEEIAWEVRDFLCKCNERNWTVMFYECLFMCIPIPMYMKFIGNETMWVVYVCVCVFFFWWMCMCVLITYGTLEKKIKENFFCNLLFFCMWILAELNCYK